MLRLALPNVTDMPHAFTSTHLWYSMRRVLYRRNLETLVDEQVHVFSALELAMNEETRSFLYLNDKIMNIRANDAHCIVETYGGRLWCQQGRKWATFATRVMKWRLFPDRVVYSRLDDARVMAYDFSTTAPTASDAMDEPSVPQPRPYKVVGKRGRQWLECTSRTAARIRRLVKDPVLAAQLCDYA